MSLKRELIYIDEKDETDRVAQYSYKGDKIGVVFKNGNKEFFYNRNRARIVRTAVSNDKAFNVFNYLKEIADTVGLKTEEGNNMLSRIYQNIEQIPEDTVLSSFLNGSLSAKNENTTNPDFFPFGFNLSQRKAVKTAFAENLSVIEGPPGTGKTQTILNIIANAVINKKSVAVVSSNNAATKNVYEKLEKNGIEFIAALLGNAQNKKEFIDSQKEIPDLSQFKLSDNEKTNLKEKVTTLVDQLSENLDKKNELALLKLQLENIQTEHEHFKEAYKNKVATINKPYNFNLKKETGFKEDKNGNFVDLPPSGKDALTITYDEDTRGYTHVHINDRGKGTYTPEGLEEIDIKIRMFSPADVNVLMGMADFNKSPENFADLYGTMLSSDGTFVIKFTGTAADIKTGFGGKNWRLKFQNYFEENMDTNDNPTLFLKFLKDKMQVKGISLYKVQSDGKVYEYKLNTAQTKAEPFECGN